MPDIAMCSGDGCPKKKRCYRFTAPPSDFQTYFSDPPLNKDGSCHKFVPNDKLTIDEE